MPGRMDGVDLASMLAATRPALPVVVMSSDPRELRRATARGLDVPTLDKPSGKDELIAAVADARRRRGRPRQVRVPISVPHDLSRAGRSLNPWEARHG